MRRILVASMIVPAALAAADQGAGKTSQGLMDRALAMGVTHDRPYRPSSRIETSYQVARTLAAKLQSQILAGTITKAPQAELGEAAKALAAQVASFGDLTAVERGQYQEAMRDIDAVVSSMMALGLMTDPLLVKPTAPVPLPESQPVEAPAAPAEVPAAPAVQPEAVKPVDPPPAEAPKADEPKPVELPPVEAPKADELKPVEAPKADEPKPVDEAKPVDAPKADEAKPVDAPKADEAKPADAPKVDEAKPADAPKVDEAKPVEAPKDKPANDLPPE